MVTTLPQLSAKLYLFVAFYDNENEMFSALWSECTEKDSFRLTLYILQIDVSVMKGRKSFFKLYHLRTFITVASKCFMELF